ncbi:MAG: methylenetetrahydrofolate reductase [Streptosporangiaceae bacterium]
MTRLTPLARIASLLQAPRYEVLPTAAAEQEVLAWVPRDLVVTVTASPARGLEPTIRLTEQLAAHGYRAVPHLSARLVQDRAQLADIVSRLTAAGVSDVFVPAGDASAPAGQYEGALPLLADLTDMGKPFAHVGITGYPEHHPRIADDITIQAMWDKRRHASYIVSNLCFDPAVLQRWISRVRLRGVTLPLLVGVAGPVERTRLLATATRIGVGESARFLAGHGGMLVRLGLPGGYSPARFLAASAGPLSDPASAVAGLHIFTFNQLRQTELWRQRLLDQLAARQSG